jgi:hypothetical protein
VQRWVAEDGAWTALGVREELEAGRAQLWCFHADEIKGIWVTRIIGTDSAQIGLIWGCAGDLKEHKDDALAFFGIIEDWLAHEGCKFVDIIGRDGWLRVLPGYEKHAVILRKRLCP